MCKPSRDIPENRNTRQEDKYMTLSDFGVLIALATLIYEIVRDVKNAKKK